MRLALFFAALLLAGPGYAAWDDILEENKKQYPACVEVTKSKLEGFAEEMKEIFVDEIFEACVEGRKIGEEKAEETLTKKKKEKLNIRMFSPETDSETDLAR